MKKRLLSFALALVMLLALLPAAAMAAEPAVSYVVDQTVYTEDGKVSTKYADIVKNWGTRGEPATFLSPMAEEFYGSLTYSSLSGYSYSQLQGLMSGSHTTYTKYDDDTKYLLTYTDCQENGYFVSCFYSGDNIGPAWDGGTTWNREHTWPQSKICNDTTGYAVQDIMMIRPTASKYNSGRNNTAYGESTGYYHPNHYSSGQDLRGDAARSVLYGYVRWGMQDNMWGSGGVIESEEILLKWMAADPVDTWEMGRNDAVQSITGTRNIFIDYPELAYVLFDEEIPADLSSPSGEAKTLPYTVTASSNNESWGTVYVSDNTVTAFPKAGYRIAGYTLVSGTANVTQINDVFVADGGCTIRINFEAVEATAVQYVENGVVVSMQTAEGGSVVFAPAHTGPIPENCTFYGWVTETVEPTAQGPATVYKPGDAYTVKQGLNTLYALYTYIEGTEGGEQWILVTNANELSVGTKVVVVSADKEVALSTNQKSNNRGETAVTKYTDNTITWTGNEVQVLTLQEGALSATYGLYTGSGYLYSNGSNKNNYLRTGNLTAEASWTITVTTAGVATLKSNGSNSNNWMRYNTQSSLFSCYGPSNQQKNVCLYRAVGGGTTMYSTLNAPVQEAELFAVCAGQTRLGTYATLEQALTDYDPAAQYIKLLDDAEVEAELTSDLYIDLNGNALSGMLTGDFKVYGMDSATDEYNCDTMGYFACYNEDGVDIIPEVMVKTDITGSMKRYLSIEDPNMGYTFHRFYLGITHATLKPGVRGVGYKAVFAGDDVVKNHIDSFGYTLQLGNNDPVSASMAGAEMVSLESVTLRVDNYDADNWGVTELRAEVFMVIDGNKVTSTAVTRTLKELVEQINEANALTDVQKQALEAWIDESKTMQSWNVSNIYSA